MCILLYHIHYNETTFPFKLVVGYNRDAYYEREIMPAEYWSSHFVGNREVVGSRVGSWFSIDSVTGKVVVTMQMLREQFNALYTYPATQFRSFIVPDAMAFPGHAEEFLQQLAQDAEKYSGFKTIIFEPDLSMSVNVPNKKVRSYEAWMYASVNDSRRSRRSLITGSTPHQVTHLTGAIGTSVPPDAFRKEAYARGQFSNFMRSRLTEYQGVHGWQELAQFKQSYIQGLFDILSDTSPNYPDDSFRRQTRGFSDQDRSLLSATFTRLSNQHYGTRLQTVLVISNEDEVTYHERFYLNPLLNEEYRETELRFQLSPMVRRRPTLPPRSTTNYKTGEDDENQQGGFGSISSNVARDLERMVPSEEEGIGPGVEGGGSAPSVLETGTDYRNGVIFIGNDKEDVVENIEDEVNQFFTE